MIGRKREGSSRGGDASTDERYKYAQGYMGLLQEAQKAVKTVRDRRMASRAAVEAGRKPEETPSKPLPETPPADAEPSKLALRLAKIAGSLAELLYGRTMMWTARILILAAIWHAGGHLWRISSDKTPSDLVPDDVLIPIDEKAPDYEGVKNYIRYIVRKHSEGGGDAIAQKWVAGIPPCFKDDAEAQLKKLGGGFKTGKVAVDKTVIYNVECRPDAAPGDLVNAEIVRCRLPNGRLIYRLQRLY